MNELNKKLAEWAGFTIGKVKDRDSVWCNHVLYTDPKGQEHTLDIPVFTRSLDACFKWLVPELYKQDYYYELLQWNSGQHKAIINKKTVEWAVSASVGVSETPALSLCLAIEKLIDGE